MKKFIICLLLISFLSCNEKETVLKKDTTPSLSFLGVEMYDGLSPYAFFYSIDFDKGNIIRYMINIEFIHLLPPKDYEGNFNKRLYDKDSLGGEFSLKIVPEKERKTKIVKLLNEEKERLLKIILSFDRDDLKSSFTLDVEPINLFICKYHLIYEDGKIIDVEREFNLRDKHLELNEEINNLFLSLSR
ncbi:hypothetical protein LXD69_04375 [Flavobacterium sediminilitoris]|uniref:Lipoprotein n=1 Tax=Flavobacterium sediminilitoris TaxID=2024526 RepID=A0ABY4HQ53_9FLAO|nr:MULTISPECIES: hypothetical protein [Flavobacterium]UOX34745.1 hypothetical protein LXD69_04375 [Flavobacterium sediminilitoris]